MEITEKQKNAIRFIEGQCEVPFTGKTRAEASAFIGKYLHDAQMLSALDGAMHMTVHKASFSAREKEGEDILDLRSGAAQEKLKGAIIRGGDPVEAMADFAGASFVEQQEG